MEFLSRLLGARRAKCKGGIGAPSIDVRQGLVSMTVAGILTPDDQARGQRLLAEALRRHGRLKVLVLAQDFEGWGKGDWSSVSFQFQFDQSIEKMAFVGRAKWRDLAECFTGKGLRQVPIEFFRDEAEARAWLGVGPQESSA